LGTKKYQILLGKSFKNALLSFGQNENVLYWQA